MIYPLLLSKWVAFNCNVYLYVECRFNSLHGSYGKERNLPKHFTGKISITLYGLRHVLITLSWSPFLSMSVQQWSTIISANYIVQKFYVLEL